MLACVTGAPGTGKTTLAVAHAIEKYAAEGRRVAANFPIDFAPISSRPGTNIARAFVSVIPDRPSAEDLLALGLGTESRREELFGLLIIDEAGIWLNARTWQSKRVTYTNAAGDLVEGTERERILDWLSHSRKYRWDVLIVVQSAAMLDKQAREIMEAIIRCRRTDRMRVLGFRLPRCHVGIMRFGIDASGPVLETFWYRGGPAHQCMDSYRIFGGDNVSYSTLPAQITKWRTRKHWADRLRDVAHWVSYLFTGKVPHGWEVNRFGRLTKGVRRPVAPRSPEVRVRGPQWRPIALAVAKAYRDRGMGVEPPCKAPFSYQADFDFGVRGV